MTIPDEYEQAFLAIPADRPYDREPQRQKAIAWFKAHGYVETGTCLWGIAWDTRSGYDFCDLEFYPLERHANDEGWDAIIGHHASGTNPRCQIGRCETLADIVRTHNAIRLINGYERPEVERAGQTAEQA